MAMTMKTITGDAARRQRIDLRRAQGDVMRLENELKALRAGVEAEMRRPGRYDRSWAAARAEELTKELVAAYARLNRLEAATR